MSYPRYISPALGSTQQIAVSPAITPASPGLYCGFVSVPMVFADCNYDTHADKSSVAQAQPFLCSRIVVEQFVKLLTRLHLIEPFLLGPAFFESTQKLLACFHRYAECALGENHHPIAESGQIAKRKQRAFPKLRHVCQQRQIDLTGKIAKLLSALQCFREDCVGARFHVPLRPIDCSIEILDRARVRTRYDHEIGVAPRTYRRFDSFRHLFNIDQRFSGQMSAALGKFLVFDVTTGQTCCFKLAYCTRDIF